MYSFTNLLRRSVVYHKKLVLSSALLLGLPLALSSAVYAAKPIDLRHQSDALVQSLSTKSGVSIKEYSRKADSNQTLHVRIQQTFNGYNVWGGEGAMHIPNGANAKSSSITSLAVTKGTKMNGTVYEGLQADLAKASPAVFTDANAQKAMQSVVSESGLKSAKEKESELLVFIDKNNKAHWAYKISFLVEATHEGTRPQRLVSIVDANSFETYVKWDDIKNLDTVFAGGVGGNKKTGKFYYDGKKGHYAKLSLMRTSNPSNTCTLTNEDVVVKDYNTNAPVHFLCGKYDSELGVYKLDDEVDAVNDGFAPANDALFGGMVIKQMYRDWYDVSVLNNADGTPMKLGMVVHLRKYDNAYWDGKQMTFGDGYSMFYPLTSLGVAVHEVSHGFTEQNSGLRYYGQSGGMNEAFSDMAAQAAEVYAYGSGNNSWQIGPEIFKQENRALRYMDKPSKDGASIDDASQYKDWIDVHYSSGVYNRLYYTLGTTKGWDGKKAFDVMVQANKYYWLLSESFATGGWGIMCAAEDLGYDVEAVKAALDVVKIEHTKTC